MISIVLLLKILGGISIVLCWAHIWRLARRTERQMECLKEHYDARISAIAKQNASLAQQAASHEDETDAELKEARRQALEAERRFSEGIASILNFSPTGISAAEGMVSGDKIAYNAATGRKGS